MDTDLNMLRSGRGRRRLSEYPVVRDMAADPRPDPFRAVVFPNRVRERRLAAGWAKLLTFATGLPDIPYIRLSKIERGEVVARADELVRIGTALNVAATDLLIDVDAADFSITDWYAPFAESAGEEDPAEARLALIVAAALRWLRAGRPDLTTAALENEHGLPPVILSRLENAQKGLARWNDQTVAALCRLFEVTDAAALRARVEILLAGGDLAPFLAAIPGPEERLARTRQRLAALRRELREAAGRPLTPAARRDHVPGIAGGAAHSVPVHGASLGDGRLSLTATGTRIDAPAIAGPRAFGLRVCRATLGSGLPGQSTVIVDPDRYPQAGGLALVRDGEGFRIVAIELDRGGTMIGFSSNPPFEVAIDTLAPADVAAVIAAVFV